MRDILQSTRTVQCMSKLGQQAMDLLEQRSQPVKQLSESLSSGKQYNKTSADLPYVLT